MNKATEPDLKADNEDIIFECPQCGKSLEIDAKGAGYMIVCPDCRNEIQVPSWDDLEAGVVPVASASREADEGSGKADTGSPEDELTQLRERVAKLEERLKRDDVSFKRLGDELLLIQAALDRITEVVESRQS